MGVAPSKPSVMEACRAVSTPTALHYPASCQATRMCQRRQLFTLLVELSIDQHIMHTWHTQPFIPDSLFPLACCRTDGRTMVATPRRQLVLCQAATS
jgi:hypothetical protein